MEWYQYKLETFEYTHPVTCQPHPLHKGEYLIPPNATPRQPPEVSEGYVAVFDTDTDQWDIVEDHRGTVIFSEKENTSVTVSKLGPIPDGYTTERPAGSDYLAFYIGNGIARQERIKKQQEQSTIDELTTLKQQVNHLINAGN